MPPHTHLVHTHVNLLVYHHFNDKLPNGPATSTVANMITIFNTPYIFCLELSYQHGIGIIN